MNRIDNFLEMKVQEFSDKFQDWTGRTNFTIAKWAIVFYSVLFVFMLDREPTPNISMSLFLLAKTFETGLSALVFLVSLLIFFVYGKAEQQALKGTSTILVDIINKKSRKIRFPFFLVAMLFTFSIAIAVMTSSVKIVLGFCEMTLFFWSGTIGAYFSCCVPKPPSPQTKLEKLTENMKGRWERPKLATTTVNN